MTAIAASTLWELLHARAERQPDRRVYTFLEDGERRESTMTHGQLYARARAVGRALQQHRASGERALLLYPPGLDYIVGFFGCMAGGAVAVPAYPPDPMALERTLPRLQAIVQDCEATVILTTAALLDLARPMMERLPDLTSLRWIATDTLDGDAAGDGSVPRLGGDDVAFLQYTSGSTDAPRGVVLTHDNLLHNSACIERCFGHTADSQGVIWLPPYHDMGLIGGIIQPLYAGFPVTLMSPLHFLQRPLRWLEAVSRYGATTSGGPNFAYDLCVRKSTPQQREQLDLRRWDLAFNGAEPVRSQTLERFADAFAPAGFGRTAFYPCYGLAEATLIASGGDKSADVVVRSIDAGALADGRVAPARARAEAEAKAVVSCGASLPDQRIVIVDPTTRRAVEPSMIGEIWVSGPSVAKGYWGRPDDSAQTFEARLDGGDRRAYLRTGDLGFLGEDGGELFVTGRLKDLIIVRGRNYYPQDIERTVERSHAAVRPGCGAVFTVGEPELGERSGGDARLDEPRLVVVSEFDPRKGEPQEVLANVRAAVQSAHALPLDAVVLVSPRTIPKTSSGKIQRFACRDAYIAAALDEVVRWERPGREPGPAPVDSQASSPAANEPGVTGTAGGLGGSGVSGGAEGSIDASRLSVRVIRRWLSERVAEQLGVSVEQLDVRAPFRDHGLSSAQAVSLSGELEGWLGRRLSPTLVYAHPTIEALARALAGVDEATGEARAEDEAEPEPTASTEPIAIIGIGCRVPGAKSPEQLWARLCEGADAITEVSAQRERRVGRFGDDDDRERWGGFLEDDDVAGFDAEYFGISPREVAAMDPQHRLLLETSASALDDAGLHRGGLRASRTGVFIGICTDDYSRLPGADADVYAGTGNASSIAANRISYWLDARGPSLAVDTACSSSLVAVHLACQSLRRGESTVALAGGVNLLLAPSLTQSLRRAGFLAADGRCKAFDEQADGYVRGEGAGVVVLKPLSKAQADGDRVHALILGSAVGSDGSSNGLTAPRHEAQRQVLAVAYRRAGVLAHAVGYVEAHGTGTALGDPIEVQALSEVLGPGRRADAPLRIGSIKSNIGHLEGAAGIAGLIKATLAVSHGQLPPSLHVRAPNSHVRWDALGVQVQTELSPWPDGQETRRAGVSSFGFGGTNAHVVLGQAPPRGPAVTRADVIDGPVLLPISGADLSTRGQLVQAYLDRLRRPDGSLVEIAAAASLRREHLRHRMGIVARDKEAAIEVLQAVQSDPARPEVAIGEAPRTGRPSLALVFSGQGAQWSGMARGLLERRSVFTTTLAQIDRALAEHLSWSVVDELRAEPSESRLHRTDVAQPVVFAVQVALAQQLRAYGIEVDAVVGHSVGEIAAAHIAGVLSLGDAARLVAWRGRVMEQQAGRGRMAVVGLRPDELQARLSSSDAAVEIAAINGPAQTVVSGPADDVEALAAELGQRDVFCRLLDHDYAFHSAEVEPCVEPLIQALEPIEARPGSMPMISTVTGQEHAGIEFGAAYWGRQMRAQVRFVAAIEQLIDRGIDQFVELGPHPTLVSGIKAIDTGRADRRVEGSVLGTLRRGDDGPTAVLRTLASLYAGGHDIEWSALWPEGSAHVELPPTPLRHQEYWLDPSLRGAGDTTGAHPLLGSRIDLAHRPEDALWRSTLTQARPSYLADHRFGPASVLPASAYFELALAAAAEHHGTGAHGLGLGLGEVEIVAPMVLDERARQVQIVLRDGARRFDVYSRRERAGEAWTHHATGRLLPSSEDRPAPVDLDALRERCGEARSGDALYQQLEKYELHYGPSFRRVGRVFVRSDAQKALAEVNGGTSLPGRAVHRVHPALLDAAAQVVGLVGGGSDDDQAFLPVGASAVRVHGPLVEPLWSHATLRSDDGRERVVELSIYDAEGSCVAQVEGLRLRTLEPQATETAREQAPLYRIAWPLAPTPARRRLPTARPPASWLVLLDDQGVGEALVEQLQARGDHCVGVRPGSRFESQGGARFEVQPERAEDLHEVFEVLRRGDHPPCRGVIHLWSLDRVEATESGTVDSLGAEVEALEAELIRDTSAALHALRELAGQRWKTPPRLWLCTRAAVPSIDESPVLSASPASAGLWGLGRTIAQEHPDLLGGCVDLDPQQSPDAAARTLLDELHRPDSEPQVAFRGAERHVARLVRAVEQEAPAVPLTCRADASYLVTGGLGELGLRVARALVDRGARRVVLMGRTALPERRQWASLPPEGRAARQVTAIQALEAAGASVHLAAVDVGDAVALREFIEGWEAEGWPPIRGVVHLAGVLHDQILMRLDTAMLAAVVHAKVGGAWLLHRLFEDRPLDFFALFSSIAAVLGSAGQGNYAAANAVLGALAHRRRSHGRPAHAIDWGPWAQLGVARPEQRGRRLASRGIEGLSPDEGVGLMAQVLAHDAPQVTAARVHWGQLARAYPTLADSPLVAALVQEQRREHAASSGSDLRATIEALPPGQRLDALLTRLVAYVARAVGRAPEDIALDRPLTSLGLDSLMGIELKNRLESESGVSISMGTLLAGPTVQQLGTELLERITSTASDERSTSAPSGSVVIPLRESGARPRLWCVHPGALDVSCYRGMVDALDPQQPVSVVRVAELEAQYIDEYIDESSADGGADASAMTPLPGLAEQVADVLVTAQPEGPILIGGWSIGGVLAFETARVLHRRGRTVALVALLDAPTPHVSEAAADYDAPPLLLAFASYLGARSGRVVELPSLNGSDRAQRVEALLRWAVREQLVPAQIDAERMAALFEIWRRGLQGSVRRLAGLLPEPCPLSLAYFRASEVLDAFAEVFPVSAQAWSAQVSESDAARIYDVPGDHYGMFHGDHAPRLAAALDQALVAAFGRLDR